MEKQPFHKRYINVALLILAFLLPVMMAKVMLEKRMYRGGVTNQGVLIEPPPMVEELQHDKRWQLIYLLPLECKDDCIGALFTLQQIPQAIGADADRVVSKVFAPKEMTSETLNSYVESSPLFTRNMETPLNQVQLEPIFIQLVRHIAKTKMGLNNLYLVDPMGNIMMMYPLASDRTEILMQGKDVLKDLKRLLKVSKIG